MAFAQSAFWQDKGDEGAFRHRFWRKTRGVAASIPFAEDLLAAYYCAFDSVTPLQVKVTLLGAIAYFVLPIDINLVTNHIRPEHRAVAKEKLAQLWRE
jgi:uncharacterized membrane protein YkvA (DUF1232 family)